jgi:hypothetical protein
VKVTCFTGFFLLFYAAGCVGSAIVLRHNERVATVSRVHRDNPDNYLYAAIGLSIVGGGLVTIGRKLIRAGW